MVNIVYLSPSTQESNQGSGGYGTEEKRMNEIADVTEKVLVSHGLTVHRNRPEMTLAKLVADSNAKRPDIHLAIHSNAGGGRGCEVYCHWFGGQGEKLARSVYSELSSLTPTLDRGVKEGYNLFGAGKPLYELAKTTAPSALVEVAFHDNSEDAQWVLANIEPIGIALAKGILKYFNVPYKEEAPELAKELRLLEEFGIINSPDYWRQNAIKGKTVAGENAAILIQRVAALLLKGGV